MSTTLESLEERLAALETEIARLKQITPNPEYRNDAPWYDQIFGTFQNNPQYEEAMRLGREYRESLCPAEDTPDVLS